MAMIEQKAAEMVLALPQTKRSLKDLKRVVELGTHAQKYVVHFDDSHT